MKILAIEKETPESTDDKFAPFLRQEANRVWELYRAGVIQELYFRRDRQEAALVMECRDPQEASHLLQSLPLVSRGLTSFEVIPLDPRQGFDNLFGLSGERVKD
jgi:hypothetical protein